VDEHRSSRDSLRRARHFAAAAAQVYDNTSAARTISAGVNIPIRTSEAITSSAEDGRIFRGVVDQDVFDVNGRIAIPRGLDGRADGQTRQR
jgi:hypothetical protein